MSYETAWSKRLLNPDRRGARWLVPQHIVGAWILGLTIGYLTTGTANASEAGRGLGSVPETDSAMPAKVMNLPPIPPIPREMRASASTRTPLAPATVARPQSAPADPEKGILFILGEGETMQEGEGASGIATVANTAAPAPESSAPVIEPAKDEAAPIPEQTRFVIVAFMNGTVAMRNAETGETRQYAQGDRLQSGETITSISEWRGLVRTDRREFRMGS